MSFERPTFSELWFRVAGIRARLRTVVQIGRQDFRGELWYVVQDDTGNQYYRLSRAAYEFVGRLDGVRTVSEVWLTCCETQGDDAITQPEVIQLLGQLYSANLLQADLPPDAAGLFRRYQTRKRRELASTLSNFLFLQIPLFDPDVLLDHTLWLFGRLFTWYGAVAWVAWLCAGAYCAIGRASELSDASSGVLDPANLPWLYLSFVGLKVLHELGHAVACKKLGRDEGGGGEVHAIGIVLMISVPFPYVDASSAWALRNKWSRVLIGGAGMIVELAVAAGCAMVWSRSAPGTAAHAIAYNVMFLASVSTLVFNGNPLLRYDAYYMLSDFLEIPNLQHGAREYVLHLVRRYLWGMTGDTAPPRAFAERAWLVVYFFASSAFRLFVAFGVFWLLADRWFAVGLVLAVGFALGAVVKPFLSLGRYLASNAQLAPVRGRAIATTALGLAAACAVPLLTVVPEHVRLEGIAEPRELAVIHAGCAAFLIDHLESGAAARPGGPALVSGTNEALDADLERFGWARAAMVARRQAAQEEQDTALRQVIDEQLLALDSKLAELDKTRRELVIHAPAPGAWIAPKIELAPGSWVTRGEKLGVVAALDTLIIHAPADQQSAARILAHARSRVEIRIRRRPDRFFTGTIEKIHPAGDKQLPSLALGYAVGGATETDAQDRAGTTSRERTFQVVIRPDPGSEVRLLSGQRVVVRFELLATSLARQWWDALRRLAQRRLKT